MVDGFLFVDLFETAFVVKKRKKKKAPFFLSCSARQHLPAAVFPIYKRNKVTHSCVSV